MRDDLLRSLRFLEERANTAIGIRRHESERTGIVDIDEMQRGIRFALTMERDLRREIVSTEDVAVEDEDRIVGP